MVRLLPALLLLLAPLLPQSPEEDRAALEEARARLEAVQDGTSDEDAAWRAAYQERIALLELLVSTASATERLSTDADLAARRVELETELAALRAEELPESVRLETPDELNDYERRAGAAAAARVTAQSRLDQRQTRHDEAESELSELPDRGDRARKRSDTLEGEDEVTSYRLDSARLETRLVAERAAYLTATLARWNEEEPVARLELERATLQDATARRLVELATAEAARMREAEAAAARSTAEAEARRAEVERDPLERFRYEMRAEAGNLRAESKQFETVLKSLQTRVAVQRDQAADAAAESDALDSRLELQPRDVDGLLRRHLERSKRTRQLLTTVTIPEIETEFDAVQRVRADVLDRQWTLSLPTAENEVVAGLQAELPARADEAVEVFRTSMAEDGVLEALEERSDQLERAAELYGSLLDAAKETRDSTAAFEDFVLGRMLWSRSAPALDANLLTDLGKELAAVVAPYADRERIQRVLERVRANLARVLAMVAGIVLVTLAARWLARWHARGDDRGGWTWRTARLLARAVWSLALPAQIWAAGWVLGTIGDGETSTPPLVLLLELQALFLLVRRGVELLLGDGGLLTAPRLIAPEVGAQIVRVLSLLTIAGQILYVPYRVLIDVPFQLEALPRLLYILWLLCANVALILLVRRNGALVRHWTREGGLVRSILRFLTALWVVLLPFHLVLEALGYRVGVERSMLNAFKVFVAVFVLGALFRLLEGVGNRIADHFSPKAERPQAVEMATRSLVRVSSVLLVIFAGLSLREWWGMGGVLSKLFVDLRLFEHSPGNWLTLWDVYLAILWIAAGHLLSVNLRRLHEILLAPFKGTEDEGSRFAFLAITRYVLIAVAYAGALLTLGFSFETLGWFATAASVGLGFGLQEIVANFISGLILLFERPVRVGDIVTIGTTSGTVDSISMRATVITNWERQTIIVPNKRFITENLTNWTRTDKVMRRELDVRVAYGADVDEVIRVAIAVVESHPAVLEEPAPNVRLHHFGVVGLEFKVLFFTAISDGLDALSEIHRALHAAFKQAGIEMPTLRPEDLARLEEQLAQRRLTP